MVDWYVATGAPAESSDLDSSVIRSEFSAIQTQMAKLPNYTSNGGKWIQVNSGGTAQEATSTPTLPGNLDGADKQVKKINLLDFGIITNAIGSIGGGTQDIDIELGNMVTGTVDTSTTTFTFSNPTASDEGCSFALLLTNGGSQTVNWPSSVKWAGGVAPTLTTSGDDLLVFLTVNGGTAYHGVASSLDSQ